MNPIVLPLAGQSYNPNAKDHKQVIEAVVAEEMKDVKEVQRQLRTLKPYLFSEEAAGAITVPGSSIRDNLVNAKTAVYDNKDSSSSEEESEDEEVSVEAAEGDATKGKKKKVVSRLNKLTKTERNAKLLRKLRHEEQEYQRTVKLWNKEINKLPQYLKDHEQKLREIEERIVQRKKDIDEERARQEKTGIVQKPSLLGRHKYRMRKTDFQTEDELAGSLRTIRAKATPADLLVDRYDSVFRRNLIEPEMPIGGDRRRTRKGKYKWHNSKGGTGAAALHEKNQELKRKGDIKAATGPSLLKNDLILI